MSFTGYSNINSHNSVNSQDSKSSYSGGLQGAESTPLASTGSMKSLVNSRESLVKALTSLTSLSANATEAFSCLIFVFNKRANSLKLLNYHTLSDQLIGNAEIGLGQGLVGWCGQNGKIISACPFKNCSTTLGYYSKDQALKSFIAVPIKDKPNGELLGVLACDSKKSYGFAKISEKILTDCAFQAAEIINAINFVDKAVNEKKIKKVKNENLLSNHLSKLFEIDDENELLSFAADVPNDLVEYSSSVVVSISESGVGPAKSYSSSEDAITTHQLLSTIAKHKKIVHWEGPVQIMPGAKPENKSFLSVPILVFEKEAGSINLLSKEGLKFRQDSILAVEKIAKGVSSRLEVLRIKRDRKNILINESKVGGAKEFMLYANKMLVESPSKQFALLRVDFGNFTQVEKLYGMEMVSDALFKVDRYASQLVGSGGASYLTPLNQVLMLVPKSEVTVIVNRFATLLKKHSGYSGETNDSIGTHLAKNMTYFSASYPAEGNSIQTLVDKTLVSSMQDYSFDEVKVN